MTLIAINTVEIDIAKGSTAAVLAQLEALLEVLNRTSGCMAYSLARRGASDEAWLISGHWDCIERMTAHFDLPCLGMLFDLTARRLVTTLRFASVQVPPS